MFRALGNCTLKCLCYVHCVSFDRHDKCPVIRVWRKTYVCMRGHNFLIPLKATVIFVLSYHDNRYEYLGPRTKVFLCTRVPMNASKILYILIHNQMCKNWIEISPKKWLALFDGKTYSDDPESHRTSFDDWSPQGHICCKDSAVRLSRTGKRMSGKDFCNLIYSNQQWRMIETLDLWPAGTWSSVKALWEKGKTKLEIHLVSGKACIGSVSHTALKMMFVTEELTHCMIHWL